MSMVDGVKVAVFMILSSMMTLLVQMPMFHQIVSTCRGILVAQGGDSTWLVLFDTIVDRAGVIYPLMLILCGLSLCLIPWQAGRDDKYDTKFSQGDVIARDYYSGRR